MIDTLTFLIIDSYCDCVKTSGWTPGGGLKKVEGKVICNHGNGQGGI